jgi:gamma-glutamyl phosphate reductase
MKVQPDNFEHLFEWYLYDRDENPNILEELCRDYPEYAVRLRGEVMVFAAFEAIIENMEEPEYTAEQEAELNAITARAVEKALQKIRDKESQPVSVLSDGGFDLMTL